MPINLLRFSKIGRGTTRWPNARRRGSGATPSGLPLTLARDAPFTPHASPLITAHCSPEVGGPQDIREFTAAMKRLPAAGTQHGRCSDQLRCPTRQAFCLLLPRSNTRFPQLKLTIHVPSEHSGDNLARQPSCFRHNCLTMFTRPVRSLPFLRIHARMPDDGKLGSIRRLQR